jgi:hypothetical protein
MAPLTAPKSRSPDIGLAAPPTCGWTLRPHPAIVARSLRWAAALLVLFLIVYGGLNWLTTRRTDHLSLWFDWELSIPFVPGMVWAYLSIVASFFLPMFALDARGIDALCRRLALATVLSGACFILFPQQLGFHRLGSVAGYEQAFALIHGLDLPHNLAPSLHVSWSLILLLTLARVSTGWLRRAFLLWLALLITSVLLVHQHHVLDVAGGILVALAARIAIRPDGHGFSHTGSR